MPFLRNCEKDSRSEAEKPSYGDEKLLTLADACASCAGIKFARILKIFIIIVRVLQRSYYFK